jgi:molybdate transport system regulatory protein
MRGTLTVRFRVDFGHRCSIGIGKIELLEGIALTGSLSEAARRMRMSYRRAWLLLADLNKSFDQPVAHSSTGGRGGGGAVLTPFGVRLVAGYRELETKALPLATGCLREAGRRAVATRAKQRIHRASLRRRTSAK